MGIAAEGRFAMRQIHRLKLAVPTALVGVLVAGVALATLVPGGGQAGSECYVEFDVLGATSPKNRLTCEDGDPACDVDGQCGNGCTFSISLCVNQTNVPGCTPKPLHQPVFVSQHLLPLPSAQGTEAACGAPGMVRVPLLRRHGGKRPGRRKILILARATSSSPRQDKNLLFLICTPRTGACPTTTTTTSTTTTTTRP